MAHCLWFRKRSPHSDPALQLEAVVKIDPSQVPIDRPRPATDQKVSQILPLDVHRCIGCAYNDISSLSFRSEKANSGFPIPES